LIAMDSPPSSAGGADGTQRPAGQFFQRPHIPGLDAEEHADEGFYQPPWQDAVFGRDGPEETEGKAAFIYGESRSPSKASLATEDEFGPVEGPENDLVPGDYVNEFVVNQDKAWHPEACTTSQIAQIP